MKRKRIEAAGLALLREQITQRYRADGGTELEWRSYLLRYEDLNARIQLRIKGVKDAAISPNILRRLFWDTLEAEEASFNIVYLNALARYISEGVYGYLELHGNLKLAQAPAKTWMPQPKDEPDPEQPYPIANAAPTPIGSGTLSGTAHIPLASFMRPFLLAGLCSGLLSFMFVLTFNDLSGYDWPDRQGLGKVMTSYFGSMVFGHISIGIALGFFARRLGLSTDRRRFFRSFLLALPALFLLTFYTRQLFVNNGWLVKGRDAFAFFGRPDFETVTIALAFCLCIALFLLTLHRAAYTGISPVLLQASVISLSCGTVFFVISTAYNILVSEGVIDPQDFLISQSIFVFRFPHPERLPLICFMVFVQMYFTLRFVGERFGRGHATNPGQEVTTSIGG